MSGLAKIKNLHRAARKVGLSEVTLRKLQLRAKSIKENKIYQISPFSFPKGNSIFFDIETDTNCDRIWLIGAMNRGHFFQFYADSWKDEKRILKDFLDFLAKSPGSNLVSYSGTSFDKNVTQKAIKRLSLNPKHFSSCGHVDLLPLIRQSYILPIKSYGLKHVGKKLRYPFKHQDIDGFIVASMYEEHVRDKKPLPKKVLEYNEDDVRAIPFIIKKMTNSRLKMKPV
jgi:predicted RecB family nuclease